MKIAGVRIVVIKEVLAIIAKLIIKKDTAVEKMKNMVIMATAQYLR